MIVPATRAIVLVAVGGGALALTAAVLPAATPAAIALAAVLAIVLTLDALSATRNAKGISASAPDMQRTARGRSTTLPLTVANRAAAQAIEIALQVPTEFRLTKETEACGTIGSDKQVTLPLEFKVTRRGEYKLEQCSARTASKLGLWSIHRLLPIATTIRVYPDLIADGTAAEFLQRGKPGARVIPRSGKGREFEKLREYLPGDSWDEIDWKATARRGKPVVRVFQIERTQEIYVALDASRLSGRTSGPDTTLDRYVHAALVMALAAEAQGDRFGLIAFSNRIHTFVRAASGKAHFKICREAIYALQPQPVEPDFGELFAFLQTRLTRRALVIVLTSLDDPLAGETFSHHVGLASRRHLVIAAMPAIAGARPMFQTPAENIDDIYEGLGGHLRWRQLAELKKSCERKGVPLHFLAPEKITGQLAGIYLDVKRRQQL